MSDQQIYFVRRRGRTDGPWTLEKLQAEVNLHKLGRHHEISADNMIWFRAGELDALFPPVDVQKIVGTQRQSDPLDFSADTLNDEIEIGLSEPDAWYCAIHDEQLGPMGLTALRQLLHSGKCALDDLVWREGYTEWVSVESVPELVAGIHRDHVLRAGHQEQDERIIELPVKQSAAAIASTILGGGLLLISWIPLFGFLGIVPIIIALIALQKISSSDGQLLGKGYAVAGIVLGLFDIAVGTFVLVVGITLWVNQ